ncbi:hypothetical protein [Archaeoglobus veneficus]|uniref:Uncharacterized protein n=1 Tax=Archaeoglobus veneficus (strain DSM 11195 / SNP6) TaxID=693661 RepID=F2KN58_ARCVS|nr:hypothetical protein [Archaeoglobus veneficus]AEA46159.1 hypothetical protein Arcve_0118 [Archaeoglobus veneficus SNP6]
MNLEGELLRKLYIHLAASFAFGFVILLWAYGLYGIVTTMKIYFQPHYVALAFTLYFILFSVFLEHRGVQMPYLLMSGALLSSIATFVSICVVNGVLWINNNSFPPLDSFLLGISLSSLAAFVIIKFVTMEWV